MAELSQQERDRVGMMLVAFADACDQIGIDMTWTTDNYPDKPFQAGLTFRPAQHYPPT